MTTLEADFGLFAENRELYEKDQAALNALRHLWHNDGKLPSGERVSIQKTLAVDTAHTNSMMTDTVGLNDQPMLTARVIQELAGDAEEPTAVLEPLLDTLSLSIPGSTLVVPSWGGMHAGDVAPGGEYPERSMELGGYVTATIGKVGIQVPLSDEMIKHSSYDVMGKHVAAAGAAMKRHKEKKIAKAMRDNGNVLFDNATDGVQSTTGRNSTGAFNGTLTLDDIALGHELMIADGFNPDTLIIHPGAWRVLSVESLRILFGLQRGVAWSVEPTPSTRGSETSRTATVPTSLPQNWNIVVTPYAPYTTTTSVTNPYWPVTDLMLCDSQAIGIIVDNAGGVQTDEFTVPSHDLRKVKLKEEYGVSILNDGKGIGLIKNVTVGRGVDLWENITYDPLAVGSDLLSTDRNFTGIPITGNP